MSKSAFLLQTAGGAVLPRVDVWIALKSNNTGTTYKSAARTTTDGLYFHPAPGDTYTVYYSLPGLSVAPASTPPSVDWFATGDTAFSVPYVAGDEIAAKDVTTQLIGPYTPSSAAGAVQVSLFAPAPSGGDDSLVIQDLINTQQTHAKTAEIVFGPGTWKANTLLPAPGTRAGGFTDSTRPLIIRGMGMHTSILQMNAANSYIFIYAGFASTPKNAQVIMSDICLDGNYSGVAGGTYPEPGSGGNPLIGLNTPYTTGTPNLDSGIRHHYERVRFYRPVAYVFQGAYSVKLLTCLFDNCGQPDQNVLAWDNIGSGGDTYCEVIGCTWLNSQGQYVDFACPTSGHPATLIFIGNKSIGHHSGGLYGAGANCIIADNILIGTGPGGIGYDATTHANNRSKNIVTGNVCPNMNVYGAGLAATNGDIVYGNISNDSTGFQVLSGAGSVPASSWGSVPVKLAEASPVGTNTVSFTSIPNIYRHLLIEWIARTDGAVVSTYTYMLLNSDSGANYDEQEISSAAAVTTSAENLAQAGVRIGYIPGASATAAYFGQGEGKIKNYASATGNKLITSDYAFATANTTGTQTRGSLMAKWRTTATAINRIDITVNSGNFVAGTVYTLYGIP